MPKYMFKTTNPLEIYYSNYFCKMCSDLRFQTKLVRAQYAALFSELDSKLQAKSSERIKEGYLSF